MKQQVPIGSDGYPWLKHGVQGSDGGRHGYNAWHGTYEHSVRFDGARQGSKSDSDMRQRHGASQWPRLLESMQRQGPFGKQSIEHKNLPKNMHNASGMQGLNNMSNICVAPRSRDTYSDTCPKFFRPYCSIFFQYLLLSCDYLCYYVSDLDSQT